MPHILKILNIYCQIKRSGLHEGLSRNTPDRFISNLRFKFALGLTGHLTRLVQHLLTVTFVIQVVSGEGFFRV